MNKKPLSVNFEFCNSCNLNCKMCDIYYRKQHGLKKNFLSFEHWKKGLLSLEKFKDRMVVVSPHWIGEPIMHPNFGKFIEFAFTHNNNNRLFRHFHFSTNGILLDKNMSYIIKCARNPQLKKDTFYSINFSLDAYSSSVYKNIKKYDFLKKVVNNVLRLLEIEKRYNLLYPKIHISFVVMEENCHEAKAFLKYWSNIFKRYDREFRVTFKAPIEPFDAVYFRRLSHPDQMRANQLHYTTLKSLGVVRNYKEYSLLGGEF